MDFKQYIQKNKKPIEEEVIGSLTRWKTDIDLRVPLLKNMTELLLESNSAGKYIRGTLVCLGYDLFSTEKRRDIYKIAAAYEILHTSLLIHDDVMDKSLLRRGRPSVFQKLGGDHYGISQAISLGDAGFFLATQVLSETTFPNSVKVALISQFSQIVLNTITGQMLDVKLSHIVNNSTEDEIIKIAELKTAHYTISGPLVLGAILAGANKEYIKSLTHFGEKLGIAFQIKDDLLGIFGHQETIGKSVTSDIEEGKNTLLILYARNHGSKEQRKMLLKYYGKRKITPKQQAVIREIFKETGAYEYSEKKMLLYANEARALIPAFVVDKTKVSLLHDFIELLIARQK
jgi:geranylgeranyl pyrophosphate synthase